MDSHHTSEYYEEPWNEEREVAINAMEHCVPSDLNYDDEDYAELADFLLARKKVNAKNIRHYATALTGAMCLGILEKRHRFFCNQVEEPPIWYSGEHLYSETIWGLGGEHKVRMKLRTLMDPNYPEAEVRVHGVSSGVLCRIEIESRQMSHNSYKAGQKFVRLPDDAEKLFDTLWSYVRCLASLPTEEGEVAFLKKFLAKQPNAGGLPWDIPFKGDHLRFPDPSGGDESDCDTDVEYA